MRARIRLTPAPEQRHPLRLERYATMIDPSCEALIAFKSPYLTEAARQGTPPLASDLITSALPSPTCCFSALTPWRIPKMGQSVYSLVVASSCLSNRLRWYSDCLAATCFDLAVSANGSKSSESFMSAKSASTSYKIT